MDELVLFASFMSLTYCVFVLASELKRGKVSTRLLAHIFFTLGIYGQIIRLAVLDQYQSSLNEPILLFIVGHFAFEFAYKTIGVRRKISLRLQPVWRSEQHFTAWQYNKLLFASLIMSIISVTAWYSYFLPYGGAISYIIAGNIDERVLLGSGHGIELVLAQIFPLANYIIFTLVILRRRCGFSIKKIAFIFIVHTIIMILLSIPFGSRGIIPVSVIWYILIYQQWNIEKIEIKSISVIGIILIIMLSVLGEFREKKSVAIADRDLLTQMVTILKDGWGYSGRLRSYADTITLVPNVVPYQYGGTYATFFTQFIPRSLYPDKPVGAAIIITKARATSEYSGRSNDQSNMIGEAFLNFGILGVALIPMIVGAAGAIVDNRMRRPANIISLMILISTMFMLFFLIQGDFVNATVSSSIQIGILFLVSALARKRYRGKKLKIYQTTTSFGHGSKWLSR